MIDEVDMNELCSHSAVELAELIRHGRISSREVVEAHVERIAEINDELNAITITLEESALAQADDADTADAIERLRCLLYTSPSPRDGLLSRMPSSA